MSFLTHTCRWSTTKGEAGGDRQKVLTTFARANVGALFEFGVFGTTGRVDRPFDGSSRDHGNEDKKEEEEKFEMHLKKKSAENCS